MKFRYATKDRIIFYAGYFFYKVFLNWFEVRRPRLKMFVYELMYSARKVFDYGALLPSPFNDDTVVTRFGTFRIRPRTVDMSNVSPAFERRDVNYMLRLLGALRAENRRVMFLDIGADIGTFAVTVGNSLKGYAGLRVHAFEQSPNSFKILAENIRINGLEGTSVLHNFALFSRDGVVMEFQFNPVAPGSSGLTLQGADADKTKVLARTLDAVLGSEASSFDAIVFKIDVEGVEADVLDGARGILASGRDIYLMIEDFIEPSIVRYLEARGARFLCKLTPYNSWWHIRGA